MLPIGDNIIAARARFRGTKGASSDWQNLFDARSTRTRDPKVNLNPPPDVSTSSQTNGRLLFSSKFAISFAITIVIVLTQIFIVHHYIGLNSAKIFKSQQAGHGSHLEDYSTSQPWICYSFPYLEDIMKLAKRFELELVVIDPDLLELLDDMNTSSPPLVFSRSSKAANAKLRGDKTIVHLTAINETSGGQPNLKLFYNALKHNNYLISKYDDNDQAIAPEVYRRPPNMFDDMLNDAINDKQTGLAQGVLSPVDKRGQGSSALFQEEDIEISKIYTEFITHLFILNDTSHRFGLESSKCNPRTNNNKELTTTTKEPHATSPHSSPFVVINIMIMYNFEYRPDSQWLQPVLHLGELDKHKLLAHKVHSRDFRLPMENYYVHDKRQTSSVIAAIAVAADSLHASAKNTQARTIWSYLEGYRVFEPPGNRLLNYVNNTYVQCKESSFNISGLRDNTRLMSSYLMLLDTAQPLRAGQLRNNVLSQVLIGLQFMAVFSASYGNFSFWLTGSSLLAYHKFCELAMIPSDEHEIWNYNEDEVVGVSNGEGSRHNTSDGVVISLELGMFTVELNSSMLDDLGGAKMIGVTMLSDWRKPNAMVSFHLQDCPNLIFNIYLYDLRRDFHENYYTTRHSMIMSHKFGKKKKRRQTTSKHKAVDNNFFASRDDYHVFTTRNLELCWTRVSNFHPFRVPCEVHDHLRRIYII